MTSFNKLLSLHSIVQCYESMTFPNAHCLLWNQENSIEALISENTDIILQENERGLQIDGTERIRIN